MGCTARLRGGTSLQDGEAGAAGSSGNICETSWVSLLCPQKHRSSFCAGNTETVPRPQLKFVSLVAGRSFCPCVQECSLPWAGSRYQVSVPWEGTFLHPAWHLFLCPHVRRQCGDHSHHTGCAGERLVVVFHFLSLVFHLS